MARLELEDLHSFMPELYLSFSVLHVALANTTFLLAAAKGFLAEHHVIFLSLRKIQLPSSSNGNFWRKLCLCFVFNVPQGDFSPECDLAITAHSSAPDALVVHAGGPGESLPPATIYLSLKCNSLRQPPLCITLKDWSHLKAECSVEWLTKLIKDHALDFESDMFAVGGFSQSLPLPPHQKEKETTGQRCPIFPHRREMPHFLLV